MLRQLSVYIPLVESLELMQEYAKFMKDLVTKKRVVSIDFNDNIHQRSAIATRSMKQPHDMNVVSAIEPFHKEEMGATIEERLAIETLAAVLMNFVGDFQTDYVETVNVLQGMGAHSYSPKKIEPGFEKQARYLELETKHEHYGEKRNKAVERTKKGSLEDRQSHWVNHRMALILPNVPLY
uniref:Integrase core domain containing protein n=1 Tax=Solanum tuberosum TaxID=4113 RepID=M1DVV2_SOLTU